MHSAVTIVYWIEYKSNSQCCCSKNIQQNSELFFHVIVHYSLSPSLWCSSNIRNVILTTLKAFVIIVTCAKDTKTIKSFFPHKPKHAKLITSAGLFNWGGCMLNNLNNPSGRIWICVHVRLKTHAYKKHREGWKRQIV